MSTIKISGKFKRLIVHSLNIAFIMLVILQFAGVVIAQENEAGIQEEIKVADTLEDDPLLTGVNRELDKISRDTPSEKTLDRSAYIFKELMQLIIALAVIVVIIIGVIWLMRILLFRKGVLKPEVLRILGQTHLSPKQSIFLVEMPGRILIIGATQNNISLLTEVKDNETIETIKERIPNGTFASMLKKESADYEAEEINEKITRTTENLRKKAATMKDTTQNK
jgi:flagellar biogenesis protein FliO